MPPRTKRNAPIRRPHQQPQQSQYSRSQPPDLLSFDPHPPSGPGSDHSQSPSPAVFELEAPPSDPELGRQPTLIRDSRDADSDSHFAEHPDYAHHIMYGPGTSGSDIEDGPLSVSTSPPDPSPIRVYSIAHNAPSPAATRSALTKLAIADESTSDDSSLSRSIGHTRSPVLARDRDPSRSTLESFSRTIRHYVPSSIPIPSAAPTPPRVSRPVSFGSFLSPSAGVSGSTAQNAAVARERTPSGDAEETWKRRGSDTVAMPADARGRLPWSDQYQQQPSRAVGRDQDMPVFSLDDDVLEDTSGDSDRRGTRYPGVGNTEEILWAAWDVLTDADHAKPRSILMLGYPTGLQLWDCSNLGTVSEMLNLTGSRWGAVEYASVLPDPPSRTRNGQDQYRQKRPLVAFSSRIVNANGATTDFVVYSLRTHEVLKRIPLTNLTSFAASTSFIVLSTSNPPSLHILSSCTLDTLYTIPSGSLVPFPYPSHSHTNSHSYSYSYPSFTSITTKPTYDVLSSLDIDGPPSAQAALRPIYALSNRLLAYVSPSRPHPSTTSPTQASSTAHTSVPVPASDPSASANPLKLGLGGLAMGRGVSQADLGTAAVKIGGSVLSGMKTLGGLAFSAARAGVSAAVSGEHSTPSTGGTWFSKSAPAATGSPHEYQTVADQRRRRSLRMSPPALTPLDSTVTAPAPPAPASVPSNALSTMGCTVLVVDLQSLLNGSTKEPELVAQFTFARPQALSALKFSADGTSLAMCAKDGHAVRVLQLRPAPRVLRALSNAMPSSSSDTNLPGKTDPPRRGSATPPVEPDAHLAESTQHVYTLRRGRTSAVVEGMEWAQDKLWFGMSTRKRTIHVFALNPLGGKPDGSSHFAGRVVNAQELVSTSTELSPLVRVRLRPLPGDAPSIPCAFTFVNSSDVSLPSSLLPPASIHFSASSSPSSVPSSSGGGLSGLSKPVSPAQRPTRPTNYKDLLVFDPTDGTLTLRRIFVDRAAPGVEAVVPGSIPVAGGMSISLPGMSTLSRSLGTSPPSSGATTGMGVSPRKGSGLAQMMERGTTEIVGRESVVGTWSLARGTDWPEVKQVLRSVRAGGERGGRVAHTDWLSRAELSTFSSSPRILPRLIYLTHQFSFHILGEDYHALIRRAHLDVPSTKIEVRKPVEVSAFATASASSGGDNDAFVASSSLSSAHGVPSSFDEPLASALSAPLHPLHPSPPVLPMLPNGVPGVSGGKAFMHAAIPIRHVAAGISDGMSEGLGRIRRELGRARRASQGQQSPRPSSDPVAIASVPLEFDEEDELDEFVRGVSDVAETDAYTEADVISRSTSMGMNVSAGIDIGAAATRDTDAISGSAESGVSASVSTPSTTHMQHMEPLPAEPFDGEHAWQGWGPEDQQAVEDAERFDDITVGFLDEEQESMRAAAAVAEAKKAKKRRTTRKK
ncbi:hypothetical protein PYCCODRAFT_1435871 [Trametes coccinea BRFM310]|uniref:BCAS3 WD40 domain-containing protein n=1 Tax=Trametes coccinea (strain BRFM310) TaxID=1353009 RepID=A0A1Y2INN0_TRAC3|nr:hypothetical protein PYCCODRAFT_1435871 [Trametes coccinea BRFM310]